LPCYYSSEVIRPALEILAQQTRKDAMEVILINDCSPNTNCEYQDLLNEFSSQLNIKYLKTEKNGGPSTARQLGINNCSCPWVLFHDDDDMLYDSHVIESYLSEIEKAKNKNELLMAIFSTRLHRHRGTEKSEII
jgi:glycosyltransferase involved in cell wall biosynthesis